MAERRMFAKSIIDSDAFLDMPLSTQALYFHLSMRADDDGFVNNPKKISRMIGADDDSLKLLTAKQFIIPFESGIVVIKHWRVHNYIQKDRYKETSYTDEKSSLTLKSNGEYVPVITTDTTCIQHGYKPDTQVRIGKYSIGKDSIEVDNLPARETEKQAKFVPPTIEQVQGYIKETGKPIDAEAFINYYTSIGWKVGKNPMKDWKAAVRNWRRRDESDGKVYSYQSKATSYSIDDIEAESFEIYNDYCEGSERI